MSERFVDLRIQAECALLLLEVTQDLEKRKALLHELRLVIAELDLEVENTMPLLLEADFIMQIETLGRP